MKPETPDRLEDCLDNWRRWMLHDRPVDGFPEKSAVLSTGGASQSFDDMCIELDSWLAEVTNTSINDLPMDQSCAIHHAYLKAVYRFRNYFITLELAKASLRTRLQGRNVYL